MYIKIENHDVCVCVCVCVLQMIPPYDSGPDQIKNVIFRFCLPPSSKKQNTDLCHMREEKSYLGPHSAAMWMQPCHTELERDEVHRYRDLR